MRKKKKKKKKNGNTRNPGAVILEPLTEQNTAKSAKKKAKVSIFVSYYQVLINKGVLYPNYRVQ